MAVSPISRHASVAAVLILVAASTAPARAEYPDRNIDLIVPYGPGGGFDLYARAVGRVMELHLPKTVKVIVRNVPGAGSQKGIATMYRAAPDGYTMGIVDLPGGVEPQIVGDQPPYDLDKVTWLGVVNIGVYSLVVGKNAPFKTLDDFRKASARAPFFATTGSNDLAMAKIVADTLKLNVKYLTGYSGGPATQLAIIRGEADAGMGMDVTIAKHLATGDLRQLVWFAKRGARDAPAGVPTADDIGHPELGESRPLSHVRGAARPARCRARQAGRGGAGGAARSGARQMGGLHAFPARPRHAGGGTAALRSAADVSHRLPQPVEAAIKPA